MTHIKICGLTTFEDAHHAAQQGADMLGFIMAPVSKRYIKPEAAREIIRALRKALGNTTPLCVGVFVAADLSPAEVAAQCQTATVDAAQVVGLDDPGWLAGLAVPAYGCIRPATMDDALAQTRRFARPDLPDSLPTLQVDAFHPTLYGGTGQTTPDDVALTVRRHTARLMLSGGLTPDNVAGYVRRIRPWAVDVASGTEASPGRKDPQLVTAFIQAVQSVKETPS